MHIPAALPAKAMLPVGTPPGPHNKLQAHGAAPQGNADGRPGFARTLDRARTEPAAPATAGGVFGGRTGGAYGPAGGPAPRGTDKDSADGGTELPPTGGPDLPADAGPVSDPPANVADKHAAPGTRSRVGHGLGRSPGAASPGGPAGSTQPHELRVPGLPVQPMPTMPAEPGDGDGEGKELMPIRVGPRTEEQVDGGPLVECPIDGIDAMAAMLATARKIDDASVRAKGAKAGTDPADAKAAAGGGVRSGAIGTVPGKNYGTEPVRNPETEGTPAGVADAGAGAGAAKAFGATLQAVLGAAADAAQAGSSAIGAAASTTPSAASAAPAATDGALLQGRLPASPGSADFAPQLGAQISTFIRDGVHHARLELNPAEMGPLTVQIKLDGLSANINLAAQHADTRHALEQAMPELASTLREAGLTLSGGGVSEQPHEPQPGAAGDADRQPANSSANGSGTGTEASRDERRMLEALPAPAARKRGVVDLIA